MSGDYRRWGVQSVSVVNVNRNDSQWNFYAYDLGNDNVWNVENRFFSRNYLFSPKELTPEGFFFSKYSFQPESILPASTSTGEILTYFLSTSILHSHMRRRKNLAKSFFIIASDTSSIFRIPLL